MIAFNFSAFLTTGAALVASVLYNDIPIPIFSIRISERRRKFWVSVLDRYILGLSDQQLVTGISILTIGFINLSRGISAYHFGLITSLGMFSCSAHLASVISLRRYFQENHEVTRIRIGLMLLFAVLQSVSLIILGIPLPKPMYSQLSCPAVQLIKHDVLSWRLLGIAFTLLLLFCYWAALSYVYPNAEVFFTKWLLTKPLECVEYAFSLHGFHETFMHWRPHFPSLALSHTLQCVWWVCSFITSLVIRKSNTSTVEASWGFGQILAVLLIAIPFLNAIETYYGKYKLQEAYLLTKF